LPPEQVRGIYVYLVRLPDGRAMLRYRVEGSAKLVSPEFKGRGRADGLWKTTCFELFLAGDGEAYREFNFSPSGQWSAYRFTSERSGMEEFQPLALPEVQVARGQDMLIVTAMVDARDLEGFSRAGISAVIEEEGGRLSYWALAHPSAQPDFHHPACFAASLEPPQGT